MTDDLVLTTEHRALLERGYPHLRVLVDEHADDERARVARAAKKVIGAIDPVYAYSWPRQVGARFVRAFIAHPRRKERILLAGAAVEEPKAAEVAAMLHAALLAQNHTELVLAYPYDVADFIFLLEAFTDTDAVLRGLVAAFEALLPADAKRYAAALKSPKTARQPVSNSVANYAVVPLGALLLRASPDVAKTARKALSAVITDAGPALCAVAWHFYYLDAFLNGPRSLARTRAKYPPEEEWLFGDDVDVLKQFAVIQAAPGSFDARVVYRGGIGMLERYLPHMRKVRRADIEHVAGDLGMFEAPETVPLMQILAAKKSERAAAWLATHGETAPSGSLRKPTMAQAEKALDAVVDALVSRIQAVRGDVDAEAAALATAAAGYMDARTSLDQEATDYLGHFFMVDGVGLERSRATAWERLSPTDEESERWGAELGKHG